MTAADYAAVTALWRACDGIEIAVGDDESTFRQYLQRNPGLSHCAEADGVLIAAALCGHDGRRGLIYHLAVAPEFRGQGIGKAILQCELEGLRDCGIARVLILVANDNPIGKEFWLSQNFKVISEALPLGMDLA